MTGAPAAEDPDALAARIVADAELPLLVGFDIDGVLSPIVDHADEASLLPGILDDVVALSRHCRVAVVSGRDVATIEALFGFPDRVTVVGTHGLERRGDSVSPDGEETARLTELATLATLAAERGGDGSWVERKPMSVTLHTRQAVAAGRATEASAWLGHAAERVSGTTIKLGHHVVELLARPASKAIAIAALRAEHDAESVMFVGDDVTDEDVFGCLGERDWSVRVGPGETSARHRLADPPAVQRLVKGLVDGYDAARR